MNLILRVLRELYVILIKILSPLFYISQGPIYRPQSKDYC